MNISTSYSTSESSLSLTDKQNLKSPDSEKSNVEMLRHKVDSVQKRKRNSSKKDGEKSSHTLNKKVKKIDSSASQIPEITTKKDTLEKENQSNQESTTPNQQQKAPIFSLKKCEANSIKTTSKKNTRKIDPRVKKNTLIQNRLKNIYSAVIRILFYPNQVLACPQKNSLICKPKKNKEPQNNDSEAVINYIYSTINTALIYDIPIFFDSKSHIISISMIDDLVKKIYPDFNTELMANIRPILKDQLNLR